MKIRLVRAAIADAEIIYRMQRQAFAALLEKYRDYDTSPGNEPFEKVKSRIEQPYTFFYLIKSDETVVGAIRVVDKKNGNVKRISPIFILPEYRNQGFAQAAIKAAEEIHGADNWALDTILQEKVNCYIYEKLGYRKTGETKFINPLITLVYYKKH